MANIKSIGGNPIVLGLDGLTDDAKAALGSGAKLSAAAESLLGTPDTAQWAQRVSTGSGAATVRSVQGAAVAWNQLIRQPNTTDTVLNTVTRVRKTDDGTVTLNGTAAGTGSAQYVLLAALMDITAGHKYFLTKHNDALTHYINVSGSNNHHANTASIFTAGESRTGAEMYMVVPNDGYTFDGFVCVPQLFDLTLMFGADNEPTTVAEFERMFPEPYYPYSAPTLKPVRIAGISSTDAQGGELDSVEWTAQTLRAAGSVADELTADELVTRVGERAYQSGDESDATVRTDGTTTYYPLTTPTTTPISPALPMTYRVEQGGSESIIVPSGEVSAAPVLTVAEGESAGELVMDALACIATPDGPVATANHAVGTYLTMQGKLYKVTSAIAVGETITAGTNVTATTVMDEILALN